MIEHTGHCLCGAVTLIAKISHRSVGACHCSMCRTWGGPLLTIDTDQEVRFEGRSHIAVFASSDWAERGFCRRCGTHLFYRLKRSDHYAIPVGLLGDDQAWTFDQQIFVDESSPLYAFANATRQFAGVEVSAMHAPPR